MINKNPFFYYKVEAVTHEKNTKKERKVKLILGYEIICRD